jgi:hypothetical protein
MIAPLTPLPTAADLRLDRDPRTGAWALRPPATEPCQIPLMRGLSRWNPRIDDWARPDAADYAFALVSLSGRQSSTVLPITLTSERSA